MLESSCPSLVGVAVALPPTAQPSSNVVLSRPADCGRTGRTSCRLRSNSPATVLHDPAVAPIDQAADPVRAPRRWPTPRSGRGHAGPTTNSGDSSPGGRTGTPPPRSAAPRKLHRGRATSARRGLGVKRVEAADARRLVPGQAVEDRMLGRLVDQARLGAVAAVVAAAASRPAARRPAASAWYSPSRPKKLSQPPSITRPAPCCDALGHVRHRRPAETARPDSRSPRTARRASRRNVAGGGCVAGHVIERQPVMQHDAGQIAGRAAEACRRPGSRSSPRISDFLANSA